MSRPCAKAALLAPLLCLLTATGCKGKTYTCAVYGTLAGKQILLKMVEVKSREECARLADG